MTPIDTRRQNAEWFVPMEDDRVLLQAWGTGDRKAGAVLIERHYEGIERFFATKAADRHDDLTQQTFLRCAESAKSYRAESSARAFLFGIARNVLLEHIRGKMRDGNRPVDFNTLSIADATPGVVTQMGENAEQKRLFLALQSLPIELQIIVELFYWEGFSVDELAECLGLPEGTVKSRLFRVRALLKKALEDPVGDDLPQGANTLLEEWVAEVRKRVPDVSA